MSPLAPLLVLWLLGLALLALGSRRRPAAVLAIAGVAAVLALDVVALVQVMTSGPFEVVTGSWPAGVGIRLRVDAASATFAALSAATLLAVLLDELCEPERSRSFAALIVLLGTGLHGAFFTGDAFNFYVFFEIAVVSSFALAAYGYGRGEVRGAFLYIVVNLVGSVMFLVGVGALYHATGTLDMVQISERVAADPGVAMVPAACLLAALGLKIGLFPFHLWLPVVYTHARPAVTAALAGALANIAAYGLLRFGATVLPTARELAAPWLIGLGGLAAAYGGLLALRCRRASEVAAYASVAHAGYIVIALGIGGVHGLAAIVLFAISGALDKTLAFLALDADEGRRGWLGVVVFASLAGMPLTAGFLGKLQLIRAAVLGEGDWTTVALVVFVGILGLGYGARYLFTLRTEDAPAPRPVWRGAGAVAVAVAVIAVGTLAAPVVDLAEQIALELSGGDR